MKSIESSRDVHAIIYSEEEKRMQRAKIIKGIEKKEKLKPLIYYDKKEMIEDEEKQKEKNYITPQEAYRKSMAIAQNTEVYRKLNENNEKQEEHKEQEDEEQEL